MRWLPQDKKSPTDRRFLWGKGFVVSYLGGKNEEVYSVELNITKMVINVKKEKPLRCVKPLFA